MGSEIVCNGQALDQGAFLATSQPCTQAVLCTGVRWSSEAVPQGEVLYGPYSTAKNTGHTVWASQNAVG